MTLSARIVGCEPLRIGNKIYGDDFVAFCFALTRRLLDMSAATPAFLAGD
jgi:hypothetical protein